MVSIDSNHFLKAFLPLNNNIILCCKPISDFLSAITSGFLSIITVFRASRSWNSYLFHSVPLDEEMLWIFPSCTILSVLQISNFSQCLWNCLLLCWSLTAPYSGSGVAASSSAPSLCIFDCFSYLLFLKIAEEQKREKMLIPEVQVFDTERVEKMRSEAQA